MKRDALRLEVDTQDQVVVSMPASMAPTDRTSLRMFVFEYIACRHLGIPFVLIEGQWVTYYGWDFSSFEHMRPIPFTANHGPGYGSCDRAIAWKIDTIYVSAHRYHVILKQGYITGTEDYPGWTFEDGESNKETLRPNAPT